VERKIIPLISSSFTNAPTVASLVLGIAPIKYSLLYHFMVWSSYPSYKVFIDKEFNEIYKEHLCAQDILLAYERIE